MKIRTTCGRIHACGGVEPLTSSARNGAKATSTNAFCREDRARVKGRLRLSDPFEREGADDQRPVRRSALDPVPGLDVSEPFHREERLIAFLLENDRPVHSAEQALDLGLG